MLNRSVRECLEMLDKNREEEAILRTRLKEALQRVFVSCQHCKKRSRLGRWVFIKVEYYVEPHGCTEGDYWLFAKDELCFIKCPNCGEENYIYTHAGKERILEVLKLADIGAVFADIEYSKRR